MELGNYWYSSFLDGLPSIITVVFGVESVRYVTAVALRSGNRRVWGICTSGDIGT